MRVIQVKLSPSCSQITLLNDLLEEHISLYNSTLECKKILYESFDGQKLSCFDAIKEIIPEFKKLGELKLANYSSAQQTIRRLDKAFNRFFHGNGFPRFKNKDRFNTVEYGKYGDGCKIKKDKLYIQNIGLVKCLWYCDINQKNIRTLSITRKNDSFYVNFIVNEDKNIRISFTNKNIGLDFGLKTFITTSDGEKYDSPKYLKKSLKRIKKANRKLSRSPNKGSIEREKSKKVLNKI